MKKTIYYCDLCGGKTKQTDLQSYVDRLDVCINCRYSIVSKVIIEKLINLRPWCKSCEGTGKFKDYTKDDPNERHNYALVDCKECKL